CLRPLFIPRRAAFLCLLAACRWPPTLSISPTPAKSGRLETGARTSRAMGRWKGSEANGKQRAGRGTQRRGKNRQAEENGPEGAGATIVGSLSSLSAPATARVPLVSDG